MLDLLKAHPKSKHIPVWVWTGLKMSGHETSCLEGGAVDYLIKGAHDMSSLPLRVRQRLMPAPAAPELLARGPLSIGKTKKEVWIKGIAIEGLTDLEFHLLLLLVKRSTQIVSWAEVEQELRPYAAAPAVASRQTNALHVHLSHLKHKLGPLGESCLVTHKGLGLQFDESRL
jgi:DNA-binding response OmpR family regulator